jgi:PII-like signaling protein
MGFGSHGKLHTAKIIDLSANLPLVIEIVDTEDKIRAFAAQLNEIDDLGLMTLEKVEVLRWGRKG